MSIPYLIKLEPAQVRALNEWTATTKDADAVRIDEFGSVEPDTIYVAQGNARAYIEADGTIREARRAD